MTIARRIYHPYDEAVGLTWGRWNGWRLEFFSFREGGHKANFAVRLKWGWLPIAFYAAVPLFGRWLRLHRGRLIA